MPVLGVPKSATFGRSSAARPRRQRSGHPHRPDSGEHACGGKAGLLRRSEAAIQASRAVVRGRAAPPRRLRPGECPRRRVLAEPADDRHPRRRRRLEGFLHGRGAVGHHPDRWLRQARRRLCASEQFDGQSRPCADCGPCPVDRGMAGLPGRATVITRGGLLSSPEVFDGRFSRIHLVVGTARPAMGRARCGGFRLRSGRWTAILIRAGWTQSARRSCGCPTR